MQEWTQLSKKYICASITYCTLHLYVIGPSRVGGLELRQWELTMVRFRVPVRTNQGTISDPGSAAGSES